MKKVKGRILTGCPRMQNRKNSDVDLQGLMT